MEVEGQVRVPRREPAEVVVAVAVVEVVAKEELEEEAASDC